MGIISKNKWLLGETPMHILKSLKGKLETTDIPEEKFARSCGPDFNMVAYDFEENGIRKRLYFWKYEDNFYFQFKAYKDENQNFKVLVPLDDLPHAILKAFQEGYEEIWIKSYSTHFSSTSKEYLRRRNPGIDELILSNLEE